ncbi:MAG: hypothetical protein KKD38_10055, partial [Candidatus Delongbacteria bacterium]|nr:hypothetical protein [Candidatus Delongbacteria bacterium]MCG2761234.1 hypothetical protein [Candidatus Delongbacteria bacterium]
DEFQKNLVILELERINAELSGKQKNPALIGYVDKMDFDRLKAIEDHIAGSNDPAITPLVADIRSIYRNIRRYSISFDDMLNNIYSEVTRVTDKRIYF